MLTLGIDPGLTGALAAVDDHGQLVALHDLPTISDGKLKWIDSNVLAGLLMDCRQGRPAQLFIERAQPMPRQGVSSTFTTGVVMGSLLATCQRLAIPLHIVTASTWKRAVGLGSDKSASLDKARLLFPTAELTRVKDHNRAEALLLAHYGLNQTRVAA